MSVKPTPCISKDVDGDLTCSWGRVYEIVRFRLLSVKPAPTEIKIL